MTRWILVGVGLGLLAAGPADLAAGEGILSVGDVRIRYIDEGRGEPVVLIHGFAAASAESIWSKNVFGESRVLATLTEKYRVIAFDCRGHGKSSKPPTVDAYGVEMARDVTRLLDHLKIEKAHVVGYSMGAIIAGRLLADSPERLHSAIFGGGGPLLNEHDEDWGLFSKTADALEQGNGLRPLILLANPQLSEDDVKRLNVLILGDSDPKALARVQRSFPALAVSTRSFADNRVPTAFIFGGNETRFTRDQIRAAQKALPGHREIVIPGGNHVGTLRLPEFQEAILSFLDAHRTPK